MPGQLQRDQPEAAAVVGNPLILEPHAIVEQLALLSDRWFSGGYSSYARGVVLLSVRRFAGIEAQEVVGLAEHGAGAGLPSHVPGFGPFHDLVHRGD